MRKFLLLAFVLLTSFTGFSQDFSNKGKNFWISYPEHINGTNSVMGLYITSDVTTTGTITVNGNNIPFTVIANNVINVFLGPNGNGSAPNTFVHMGGIQDGIKVGGAIHVVAAQPVVVYAHIIFSARSGASLILPTPVWGKEYIVPSYPNSGGNGAGQGFGELNIMASLPNTVVEITPRITTRNGVRPAGVPYQITLANPGDVYQVQFPQSTDLSGTLVRSIASGTSGCQPIAVVSATTWTALNCGSGTGGDNFYQQLFPYGSWGKQFLTAPLKKTANPTDHNTDIVRVYVKDPATVVQKTENGLTTTLAVLNPGNFYEYSTEFPTFIQADKAVQVMEYVKSQNCNTAGSPQTQSDPEMIAVSAVEQTINDITVFSAFQSYVPPGQSNVTAHYINVIMKTANTGTFTINGTPPTGTWTSIPTTNYSYLKQNIPTSGSPISRLRADSGFSAIAYGFGDVESYGYSAGTNVKDLTQALELQTEFGIETSPSVCTNSPFKFKIYFPDETLSTPPVPIRFDSLRWDLSNSTTIAPNNFPILQINPTIDSTNIRNGRVVNWYSLPSTYSFNAAGTNTLILTTYKSTNEGCGNELVYEFPIQISTPPTASFTVATPGCYLVPVVATETTSQSPKATYKLWWEFFDPVTNTTTVYTSIPSNTYRTVSHPFTTPGVKRIRHASITTPGCLSDTIVQMVTLPELPLATISGTTSVCINSAEQPITFTGSLGIPPYTFTYRINGGAPLTVSSPGVTSTATVLAPTNVAGTFVYTLDSVRMLGSTLCVNPLTGQQVTVTVNPDATIAIRAGDNASQTLCINNPMAQIRYDIAGSGTGGTVTFVPVLPGVTGTYAGGVVTIQGTPTLSGTFSYTVTPTGPCPYPGVPPGGIITVNNDATISLQSTGTDNQTKCVNTAIINIDYLVAGGATGATIAWVPTTPTGISFAPIGGGIYRISGASSVTGTFTYTINTQGPCIKPSLGGTLIVTAEATIAIRAGDNASQTLCINNPMTQIRYDIAGSGTGGTVTFVPVLPGVTGTYAGGVVTIQGTPTLSGTFSYTITPTGPCPYAGVPPGGIITVNDDATISLQSTGTDNQTKCVNTAITNIDYLVAGGATGATIAWVPTTPTGISFAPIGGGIYRISGASSVTGTFTYTINTQGPCIKPSLGGTLTVNPDATIAIRAGDNASQTLCINNPMAQIRYDIAGSGTGGTVTFVPVLPGVTGTYAGGVVTIQGTPTLSGTFSYTITPTGPCPYAGVPPGGIITVNNDATISLQSTGTDNQTKCVNTAITNIDYLVAGGATGATIAWVPTTPTGISFAPIGGGIYRISGASSVTGTFTYTINTQGPCIKPSLGGTLTVNPDATIAIRAGDNASQTLCINNPMAQIRYDIAGSGTGGTVTFVPVLPGVTGTYAGGVVTIQGTPTLSGTFSYTITPTGPCPYPGVPPGGIITVNNDATISLQSTGTDNQTKCVNTAITNIDYLVAGGATGATITWVPTTPTGISFTPIGGGLYQIAGASSVTGTFNYTINTQGPCIKPSLGGTLTINPAPSASIAGTAEVCQNNPVWPGITFTGSGGTVPYTFTYTIDAGSGPGLPQTITTTGLNTSIQVQQSTTVAGTFTYKLLSVQDGSTSACSQAMNVPVQVIKVNELPNGTISGSNLVCINSTPRPDITFTASGGIVPYTFTYQVLPAGPLQTISTTGSNTSVTLQAPTNVAGTFTYRLISISDGSTAACVQNATVADVVIGVSDVFPAPDFAFNNSVCIPNAVVQFQNLSNIANGTPLTYLWNFGDGSPTQVSVNPSHQYSNVGPFNVSLKATSNAGCITDKVVVMNNIHPQPKANFSFNKPSVCIGDDVTFTDLSDGKDGTINQWHWDMGDGGIKTTSTVTYTYTDTITYNIKLYTINTQNCNSDTITKQFTVYPYPHVNAGPDRSILEGGQITLSPVVYGNDMQFLWTPNQYLIDNRIEKVKVNKPLTDMTYRLTVTARGGCSLSDDVFVKLLKFPIIPNTFTPNNDGINDTWRIDYLNTYPDNLVQVFTRTGQLVFESRGYNTPWDGTIKGKPLPFDTYYYIIEPGNGREPLTGYVTIIK